MAFVFSNNLRTLVNTTFLLLLCFFFTTHIRSSPSPLPSSPTTHKSLNGDECIGLQSHQDHHSKCLYLKAHFPCVSQGNVNYLHIFYCNCGRYSYPPLGYTLLALWLLVLFYLLENTASQYLYSSVESLSRELRLSPTTAGVMLLSLGNDSSPDVFASIVSHRLGSGEVGLSIFVSCVVVGVIHVCGGRGSPAHIDRSSFDVRDICLFVLVLSSLLALLLIGPILLWGAIGFASLYFVYASIVSVTKVSASPEGDSQDNPSRCFGMFKVTIGWFFYLIDMPLYLPRRLTIPDITEERWSRQFAVASVTLAPLLVATMWNSKRGAAVATKEGVTIYVYAGLLGLVLGIAAFHTTKKTRPPEKMLLPWLTVGFLMSLLWSYIIAEELVGLLISLGHVFGINPAILGLTVFAWWNCTWDLIANLAMAMKGGQDGAQIAISGGYVGPIFNTLTGLGLSLVVSAWAVHPAPSVTTMGPALFEILGFVIVGLLWALVILPSKDMKLDRVLGFGLLAIYICSLSSRLSQSLGLVQV